MSNSANGGESPVTYSIVFDNINGEKKARDVNDRKSNRHFDFIQGMAVTNRVPYVGNCQDKPQDSILNVGLQKWLVTPAEYNDQLRKPLAIIVQRYLVDHMKFFHDFKDLVVDHIPHEYSNKMAEKSVSVSTFNGRFLLSKYHIAV